MDVATFLLTASGRLKKYGEEAVAQELILLNLDGARKQLLDGFRLVNGLDSFTEDPLKTSTLIQLTRLVLEVIHDWPEHEHLNQARAELEKVVANIYTLPPNGIDSAL